MVPGEGRVAAAAPKSARLVTFLGTTNYAETTYRFQREGGHSDVRTRFAAHALAEMFAPEEVLVLTTVDAWNAPRGVSQDETHGANLRRLLGPILRDPVLIPFGRSQEELWGLFEHIKNALRVPHTVDPALPVVLDITHGFRAQPFFAGAVLAFLRAVSASESAREVRVVYGAYEAGTDGVTPVWDLTAFTELVDTAHSVLLFLRTGRPEGVSMATTRLGRELARAWAEAGRVGERPDLDRLGQALSQYGRDIATVRAGSLLFGSERQGSTALRLAETAERSRAAVEEHIPPLADILDRIVEQARHLAAPEAVHAREVQRALARLAKTYLSMGRYSEATAVIREGRVSGHAAPEALRPGPGCTGEARQVAERRWSESDPSARTVADVRNDVQHAGFRTHPKPAATLIELAYQLSDSFSNNVDDDAEAESASAPAPSS